MLGPGLWALTCPGGGHEPYRWEATAADRTDEAGASGLAAEMGLYDDLPRCLVAGEPFVEYGVVEHRYSELRPRVYEDLLRRYSHTRIERNKPYTTSVFVASALSWLLRHGDVVVTWADATGYWSYNGVISYWALPPGPAEADRLTWVEYATANGLDPDA